ncbi:hypothetical protein ILUMI_09724 [Ignelater luminosus]|uniref:Uncharacterized protein n=1 Tax=Ignelater luminosus TaxID=2038154 RepID=A0A8K0CZ82_IGNLU|nr:hypothetical protein ILUMI_09724 [Ignelater luminosus]
MAEKSLICECDVASDLCNVGEKKMRGLVNASDLRKDGKVEGFRNKKHGVVHASCRKEYTRADSIKRFLREAFSEQQPSTSHGGPRLRSAEVKFDFKTIQQCLNNYLPPTEWGWNRGEDGSLTPVTTKDPVAPEAILNSIFC